MVSDKLALVVTEGDGVMEPCGLAEATDDGTRLCLVSSERAELRLWPDLVPEAVRELPEALVGNYNGVRLGGRLLVSAAEQEEEGREYAVVLSDTLELVEVAPGSPACGPGGWERTGWSPSRGRRAAGGGLRLPPRRQRLAAHAALEDAPGPCSSRPDGGESGRTEAF